jgi:hypothetical protein
MEKTPEIDRILEKCFLSTKVASKVIFPDRFFRKFSSLHDEIFKVLDDDKIQKVVIAAPRGFGKTTIDTIAYPGKKILFREKKFIVPISSTATNAVMQGENLKRELTNNIDIQRLFGPMKSEKFSAEQWITSSGTMVMPRGAGQQVRGILFDRFRPDLIICDDLENAESVESEEQRAKLKQWFFSDVCNSVDRGSKGWKIVVVGTVLHQDSLLVNLLEDPDWHAVWLSLCDDNLKSNWPDFMSDDEVKELYESHKNRVPSQLDLFYREYRNIPISTEDAIFKSEYFKSYQETELIKAKNIKNLKTVVIIDPAKTVKLHSADSAIVGVTVNRETRAIYVRDIVSDKLYPDQLYNAAIDMVARLGAFIIAPEVTSLNEFILQPLKNQMKTHNCHARLVEMKARGKKEDRIAALVPFYRQGFVYHNESCCQKLEAQLMAFPKSRLWDIMDALAYIVELMEMENEYFEPSEMIDDYSELDNEEPLIGWRMVI